MLFIHELCGGGGWGVVLADRKGLGTGSLAKAGLG